MKYLELKVPPALVVVIVALIMWLVSGYGPALELSSVYRLAACSLLILLGVSIGVAGIVSFVRAKTTVNPLKPETSSSLVTSGVYRYTRNPMYLGLLFGLLAWAGYLANFYSLLSVLGYILYMNRFQILPEERALALIFKQEFFDYKSKVRCWL